MVVRRAWLWLILALLSAVASTARAESYEWERTEQLLVEQKLELDPAAEGKRIAWVRVVRDDVFVEDEVWPTWFDWFHWTTQDDVIRRELLFEPGGSYEDARIEETMRNLRGMGIFALVRIVAVRTADPNQVGVVVHTRDMWSLRLEQDFTVTTQIDSLLVRVTERNLFGRNKSAALDYTLLPKTYTLRESYYARRVLGSAHSLTQSAALVFNRESNQAEGSTWSVAGGRPFYNLRQRYAWTVDGGYDTRVARQLRTGEVLTYPKDPEPDAPFAQRVWRQRSQAAAGSGYLRFGERYKASFGLGWDYRELAAKPIAETMLPDVLRDGFYDKVLPKQRLENGPTFSYDLFVPKFTTFVDLATFGQSENVRVGPSVSVALRAPLRALGSSSDSWVLGSSLGYVAAPGGGLVEARIAGSTRYEESQLVDQLFTALVRGATPVFSVFRVVARASLESRRNDTQRSLVALGASNGLRGYPSQYLLGYGASRVLGNLELRTLPIAWQAVHVGGVFFCDVGSVYERWRELELHYALGVGIRFLFPQFNRYPFALDGGMSADPDFRFVSTFQSGQVVRVTAIEE